MIVARRLLLNVDEGAVFVDMMCFGQELHGGLIHWRQATKMELENSDSLRVLSIDLPASFRLIRHL
jgi:hypothetical protein